ncbi:MAG TPA: dihydropteroate synthase [Gammaproteobacteria bacterium]|jgi:2-amino-4-hydroxy-6-hydroxymethyldihydropteridine diphosphokinase/dihydropteroate synthase|nr:dihydropteroate synthase [Gammaproteobacteria bacterium]
MVILGLGSNRGNKLHHLRSALSAIKNIAQLEVKQVSPVYVSDALLPDNAPLDWDTPYLNLAVRCETSLTPFALLHILKDIQHVIGGHVEKRHWGPRIIDIDILAWDQLSLQDPILTIPHRELENRPFALWPLADVAPFWVAPSQTQTATQCVAKWGSRFSGEAPFHTRQIAQRVDGPEWVGIINLTTDSFSDGGYFIDTTKALEQAAHLLESGATVLDIGAQATSPGAQILTPQEEWERLAPILMGIKTLDSFEDLSPTISVDTYHPEVAALAIAQGADWINDVGGLDHPEMRALIATHAVDCVMMHHLSLPADPSHTLAHHENPVPIIYDWAVKRIALAQEAGIKKEKIIFDPGIGFGLTATQSLHVLQQIDEFKKLGVRVMIGHSRKSFLSLFTDKPARERDIETLAISLALMKKSVDYIRVHDVDISARSQKVMAVI